MLFLFLKLDMVPWNLTRGGFCLHIVYAQSKWVGIIVKD